MLQPGRKYDAGSGYRYGFNGQEKSTEVNEAFTTAEFWEYDSRIGRRWNIDPKPVTGISVYSSFTGNPIWYADLRGDSIRAKFYDVSGHQTNVIPETVQKMYNDEYGIKVGYDAAKGLLYKAGDVETTKTVSPAAKSLWEKQLGDGVAKGSIEFGYGLQITNTSNSGLISNSHQVVGVETDRASKTTYVDLLDFNGTGAPAWLASSINIPIRARNLARCVEHDYFGHAIFGRTDIPRNETADLYNPGYPERVVNVFRRQMLLPQQLDYGGDGNGDIRFGPSLDKTVPILGTQKYYNRVDNPAPYIILRTTTAVFHTIIINN